MSNREYKVCLICGDKFYKDEIAPHILKRRPWNYFKRCSNCRGRTDFRPENYFKEYKKRKKGTGFFDDLAPINKIIYLLTKSNNDHILTGDRQAELDCKLLDSTITQSEVKILKHHYICLIWAFKYKLDVPKDSPQYLRELNKKVLRKLFLD